MNQCPVSSSLQSEVATLPEAAGSNQTPPSGSRALKQIKTHHHANEQLENVSFKWNNCI